VNLEYVRLDKEAIMPAGEQLRQRPQQFAVKYDEDSHVWRVLDTWNKSLEALQATDEIPDDHPAMVLLPMAGMIEVVRAAEELNLLEHMFGGVPEEELAAVQEQLAISESTIKTLKEQLELARTANPESSEPLVVKEQLSDQSQVTLAAINALTQITGQSQIDKVVNGRTTNA
tara:strand:+ start:30 stop:548 length:519 start_codon:yes stop_codon:yes gene_type:complete